MNEKKNSGDNKLDPVDVEILNDNYKIPSLNIPWINNNKLLDSTNQYWFLFGLFCTFMTTYPFNIGAFIVSGILVNFT